TPAIVCDVAAVFPFRYDSFQVELTRFRIQPGSVSFEIVEIQKLRFLPANQFPQSRLPFKKWQRAEILPIEPQQIKRIEEWLRAVKHQRFELGPAVLIKTHNLAIKNRFIADEMICNRAAQLAEGFVFVTAAGYETALSTFDVSQRTEPIEFDFVQPVRMVEG